MIDFEPLIRRILQDQIVDWHGLHGLLHWGRVHDNGVRVAEESGANIKVVRLFAFFHDSQRHNDGRDVGHGARGAEYAKTLRGELFELTDREFTQLYIACCDHTDQRDHDDITIQTCFDADRLDLLRAGIVPDPGYLNTACAKSAVTRKWANKRAEGAFVAGIVSDIWREQRGRR